MFVYFWERERERAHERGRGGERGGQRIQSRLCAGRSKPRVGLKLTNCETLSWAEVRHSTDWAQQGPLQQSSPWQPAWRAVSSLCYLLLSCCPAGLIPVFFLPPKVKELYWKLWLIEAPDFCFTVHWQHLPDFPSNAHSCHHFKNSKFQNQIHKNFAGKDSAQRSSLPTTTFSKKFHTSIFFTIFPILHITLLCDIYFRTRRLHIPLNSLHLLCPTFHPLHSGIH